MLGELHLGFFGGSNMSRKLNGFWILHSTPQWA